MTSTPSLLIVGRFAAPTGLGQSARNIVETLAKAGMGVDVENIRTTEDSNEFLHWVEARRSKSKVKNTHVFTIGTGEFWFADLFHKGRVDFRTQHITALWPWEIEEIPDYLMTTLQYADQVFALSEFSALALTEKLGRPVRAFPTYGEFQSLEATKEKNDVGFEFLKKLNLPEKYILCRFDARSGVKRKNPDAVLNVWEAINSDYPEVYLVIKSSELNSRKNENLVNRISNLPRVFVIDEDIPEVANIELMRRARVAISLHRAEGLGLNLLEAVAADIPSVFTAFSGITEELSEIGFPVKYSMCDIGPDVRPYPAHGRWAEVDVYDAILQTKRALDLVLSGEWHTNRLARREWATNFYRKSALNSVEMINETLKMKKDKATLPRRRILGLVYVINRFWRRMPLGVRNTAYKYVQPFYKKFLL